MTNEQIKTATLRTLAAIMQAAAAAAPVDWGYINQLRVTLEAVNSASTGSAALVASA